MVSSSVRTETSTLNLRRWRPHRETTTEGRFFGLNVFPPEATILYGGEPSTLSEVGHVLLYTSVSPTSFPGHGRGTRPFWGGWVETSETPQGGSESTNHTGSAGERCILMPRPWISHLPELGPMAQDEWIPLWASSDSTSSPPAVGVVYVPVPANLHNPPTEGTFYRYVSFGGRTEVLEFLEAVNPAAAERVKKLAKLEPDWDGYGGDPPTGEAFRATVALLLAIGRLAPGLLEGVFISPSPDGGFGLEWELDSGAELVLIIPPSGTDIRYLLDEPTSSGDVIQSEGVLPRDATLSGLTSRLTP